MTKDTFLTDFKYSQTQLRADVDILRRWLTEQTHLPLSRLKEGDAFLRNFLVGCKGSLEKSKKKLDNYYSFRNSGCAFYGNYDLTTQDLLEMKKLMQIGFLDRTSSDGTRYIFTKPFKNLTFDRYVTAFQLSVMILELALRIEELTPMKMKLVFDFGEGKLDEYLRVNPILLRDYYNVLQKALPFRVEHILYVNIQPALSLAANYLLKPFLSKKMNERLVILSTGWDTAGTYIPNDVMPSDFDGRGQSLQSLTDDFFEEVISKRHWFMNDLCEKTDEAKRSKHTIESMEDSFFGINGSFKALRID